MGARQMQTVSWSRRNVARAIPAASKWPSWRFTKRSGRPTWRRRAGRLALVQRPTIATALVPSARTPAVVWAAQRPEIKTHTKWRSRLPLGPERSVHPPLRAVVAFPDAAAFCRGPGALPRQPAAHPRGRWLHRELQVRAPAGARRSRSGDRRRLWR